VQTPGGRWLVVHGSVLGEPGPGQSVALILEPAGAQELAPLIVAAYGLTARERDIAAAVARGLSTKAIAERLVLSPYTVQDHLKSIFEKTQTNTRRELVARLFYDHHDEPVREHAPLAVDGWFA
jgi:DNA-binding NarL/FixJ family response regulator